MTGWTDQLQPASFRGVPFGVLVSEQEFGRRQAVHEYAYRDKPWIEDLGRATRRISLRAFLIENSLIYGGGDAIAQKNALIGAVETKGAGTLVHPTLGSLTVSVLSISILDQWDTGRYFEFSVQFLEAGEKTFPSASTSTGDKLKDAANNADSAASKDFAKALAPLLPAGTIIPQTAALAVGSWGAALTAIGQDATGLAGLAAQLPGSFGRFFNGANVSALSGFSALLSPATTLSDLIAAASSARTAIGVADETLAAAAGALGLGASDRTPADLAAAAQGAVGAAVAAIANPADGIRLLSSLAQGVPVVGANASATGAAVNDLFRRAAVTALARVGGAFQPQSYDDATAVRETVTAALDAEIATAGDEAADDTFNALRTLRVAVVQDLTARGATLAPIVTVALPAPEPSLVLAQRLYRDPGRADQLVAEAGFACDNPLFMPSPLRVLAS